MEGALGYVVFSSTIFGGVAGGKLRASFLGIIETAISDFIGEKLRVRLRLSKMTPDDIQRYRIKLMIRWVKSKRKKLDLLTFGTVLEWVVLIM